MSRPTSIAQAFKKGKAFIGFVTAGDPSLEQSLTYIEALVDGGADLIEIGIPFSDPIAEGPVIQGADLRALRAGTTLDDVFALAKAASGRVCVPLVFLTYLNPVFHMGYAEFFARCAEVGVAGVIIPDLPFEEQGEVEGPAKANDIDVITLVAPTSADRIRAIAERASGFLYVVSSMGVTVVRSEITTDLGAIVAEIRRHTKVPVAIGFGIATPEQATAMGRIADGVIVGSRIVSIIADDPDAAPDLLRAYARSIKVAANG